ncbi:MAG TPA: acylneuraminate cytidylyltransferase [Microlunatus sp.]|nr:acylneuraminate cytidylyltransferase [Microlunatus sp.]
MSSRVVAVIPARGGSKGVPGKNLRRVGGVSLVARAVGACRAARQITEVHVSTDDADIADEARSAGAAVVDRPAELAGDLASSESALLHALNIVSAAGGPAVDVLVFVQCTSPFIAATDLDAAVTTLLRGAADSVFSGIDNHAFLWRPDGTTVVGVNHDAAHRLRRQDREPEYRETGAFYAFRADRFGEVRHRFFDRVAVARVTDLSALEIDTEADLEVARSLAPVLDARPTSLAVRAVATDFDGVHTDDRVLVDQHAVETVRVSRSDGLGVSMLRAAGIPFVIVSTERNPVVGARAAKLRVDVLQGVDDKICALTSWLDRRGVAARDTAFVGNDVNDLPVMAVVGWPIAVADAHPDVLRAARLVLTRPGGGGAVREVCDLVLAAQRR